MNSTADSRPTQTKAQSKSLSGAPFLRYYEAHHLTAWRPEGVLDDTILDQITDWLLSAERDSAHFKRYIDLSRISEIAVRTSHIFEIARRRAAEFAGPNAVRTAIFCDEWIGFGIAQLYETLMEDTLIRVKAFRERSQAAKWLELPAELLTLEDTPTVGNEGSA